MPAQGETCGSDDVRVDSMCAFTASLLVNLRLIAEVFLFPGHEIYRNR